MTKVLPAILGRLDSCTMSGAALCDVTSPLFPSGDSTQSLERFAAGSLFSNRYRIARQIGRGGFGVVYLARDEQLHHKPVVVKVLTEGGEPDAWRQAQFRKESEALARIDHSGVVGILDQGATPDGNLFIVLQFIDGVTLRSVMRGPLELTRAAGIILQTARALAAVHNQGVCHRDLKPENIMLRRLPDGREQVVLIDFGMAVVEGSRVAEVAESKMAGSPRYMAPEQWLKRPEPASDIYSLGVIAYEMTTGRPPFHGNSSVEIFWRQQRGVQQKPRAVRPELPQRVEDAILKALALDPRERHAHASEFGDDFARGLAEAVPTATQIMAPAEKTAPEPGADVTFVLSVDVVGYASVPASEQLRSIGALQDTIRGATAYRQAQARGDVNWLSTGKGEVLTFLRDAAAAISCAVELSKALRRNSPIGVRMGLHTGPVGRGADDAEAVMELGDNGHILVSGAMAGMLKEMREWSGWLHDLGECQVERGLRVHIYSICKGGIGNPTVPRRLGGPVRPRRIRSRALWAAAATLLIGLCGGTSTARRGMVGTGMAGSQASVALVRLGGSS